MTNEQIQHMVQRFLGWKLPENFNPDAGISFEPEFNKEYMAKHGKPPMRHEPYGTNLLDATQAEMMVRYMLEGMLHTPIYQLHTPKNSTDFDGEFICFFSEDPDCEVLFHSFIAEEVYKQATEMTTKTGRHPTVIRIDCKSRIYQANI